MTKYVIVHESELKTQNKKKGDVYGAREFYWLGMTGHGEWVNDKFDASRFNSEERAKEVARKIKDINDTCGILQRVEIREWA